MINIMRIGLALIFSIFVVFQNLAMAQPALIPRVPGQPGMHEVEPSYPVPRDKLLLQIISITDPTSFFNPHVASPLILKFELQGQIVGPTSNWKTTVQPGPPVVAPSALEARIALIGLKYELYDENSNKFFSDWVDLYGQTTPGSLVVKPGIAVPEGSSQIKIIATASYKFATYSGTEYKAIGYGNDNAIAEKKSDSIQTQNVMRYANIRDGIVRRHILDSGRLISGTWLKEYEPLRDRRELLYHSRTFTPYKGQGGEVRKDQARVYIPWVRTCGCDKNQYDTEEDCKENNGHWENCGKSVSSNALTVYTAGENPLLRGGLAMAGFSHEMVYHLGRGDAKRLSYAKKHALKLLEYFEKSEYIDPLGNKTGFFLRTDFPGSGGLTGREYYYASIDEIVGMVLGLYYMYDACKQIGDTENRTRIENLVSRLGKNLMENYYFIVPPKNGSLLLERHKGWSGGYFLRWYLSGAFKAITGQRFSPDEQLHADHDFWKEVSKYPFRGNQEDEDVPYLTTVLKMNISPYERAVLAIQGIGWLMYWGGYDYKVIKILTKEITFKPPTLFRWNFTMLLHAFQLGMADTTREAGQIEKIKLEMSRLIKGVLCESGAETKINKARLLVGYLGTHFTYNLVTQILDPVFNSIDWAIFLIASSITQEEKVGTRNAEPDFYAAQIAAKYGLVLMHEREEDRQKFIAAMRETENFISQMYSASLPVGERSFYYCVGGDNNGRMVDISETACPSVTTGLSAPATTNSFNYRVCWTEESSFEQNKMLFLYETNSSGETTRFGVTGTNYKSFSNRAGNYSYQTELCYLQTSGGESGGIFSRCDEKSSPVTVKVVNPCPGGEEKEIFLIHNPDNKQGKWFIWESDPSRRVLSKDTDGYINGIYQAQYDLYIRGLNLYSTTEIVFLNMWPMILSYNEKGYDSMFEAEGLGYFYPEISNTLPGVFGRTFDDPQIPYLPLCSTTPRLIAAREQQASTGDRICGFSFPKDLMPDKYDSENIRNDTYENATTINIGKHKNLNLDKATHEFYSKIDYAKYTSHFGNSDYFIPLISDYDYYKLSKSILLPLKVELIVIEPRKEIRAKIISVGTTNSNAFMRYNDESEFLTYNLNWQGNIVKIAIKMDPLDDTKIQVLANNREVSWNRLPTGLLFNHKMQIRRENAIEEKDVPIIIEFIDTEYKRLIVDEQVSSEKSWRITALEGYPKMFFSYNITVDSRQEHFIMVTGKQGKYQLNVQYAELIKLLNLTLAPVIF